MTKELATELSTKNISESKSGDDESKKSEQTVEDSYVNSDNRNDEGVCNKDEQLLEVLNVLFFV